MRSKFDDNSQERSGEPDGRLSPEGLQIAGVEEELRDAFGLANHEARILVALGRSTARPVGDLERMVGAHPERLKTALKSMSHAGFVFAQSNWAGSPDPIYALTENGAAISRQVTTWLSTRRDDRARTMVERDRAA